MRTTLSKPRFNSVKNATIIQKITQFVGMSNPNPRNPDPDPNFKKCHIRMYPDLDPHDLNTNLTTLKTYL
jgi:hypothetical protein